MLRSFFLTEHGDVHTDIPRDRFEAALHSKGVLWVDFFRPTREEQAILSDVFHFHPLAIDDCLRPVYRPRVDTFDDHLFLIVHGPDLFTLRKELSTTEVDAFLGRNYLVTHHTVPMRSIIHMIDQCERTPRETLGRGVDFLLYTILDQMAENYGPILSRSEKELAHLETMVLKGTAHDELLPELMQFRHDLVRLRRVISAQRDAVVLLAQQEEPLVSKRATVYYRDVVGIYQRVLEAVEAQSDHLGSIRDTYLSMSTNRATEVMKFLTILATIMAPPTMVASIYGMNFKWMPELEWRYGYPLAMGLMAAFTVGMLYYFRRRKWL